jgi:glycine/D-amino acid oxidase-like deaminating enzyme
VRAFTTSDTDILNDGTITLTWEATGEEVYLYACPSHAEANCLRPQTAAPTAAEGSLEVSGFYREGPMTFRLEATSGGQRVTRDVSVEVTCAQLWLGDAGAQPACPEEPARTVFAVFQPFERGALLWFSDTRQIYVLTSDGQFRVYQDSFVDGMPDPDVVAPDGLLTPVRGFGRLWQSLGGARSPLGWAAAPETGFDSARQAAGRTSYTTYVQGTDDRVYAFTEIPGVPEGYWTLIAGAD